MSVSRAWLKFAVLLAIVTGAYLAAPLPALAQDGAVDTATTEEAAEPEAETEVTEEEAEEEAAPLTADDVAYAVDNFFLFICAVLVLFMQAGFAMVEAGFNQSKNAVNILFKNAMDVCVGLLLFWLIGFGLMYPKLYMSEAEGESLNGYVAFGGIGIYEGDGSTGAGVLLPENDWFFQAVFAATAATIVSGAVAGRMKFTGYLVYSAILTAVIYPISGYWFWGGGWLSALGFTDFAGSVGVHAVGGFAGLAGAIALGARKGKFSADGKPQAISGHSLPIAALGVFILWVGWYGFNPGSVFRVTGPDSTATVIKVAVNTSLAAAAGGLLSMVVSWAWFKKPDLSMALNGILAGLVGVTANADSLAASWQAIVVGAVAGVIVVVAIWLLDQLRIDDPVGAFPVHGACGIWGGLATGIFGGASLGVQILGCLVIPAWAFFTMLGVFYGLKAIGLLRVTTEDEQLGLDISEHGMMAYAT